MVPGVIGLPRAVAAGNDYSDGSYATGAARHVAAEVKRKANIDAIEQLTRYLELLDRDPLLKPVRGILAAQSIAPQARTLAEDRGITVALVDYDAFARLGRPDRTTLLIRLCKDQSMSVSAAQTAAFYEEAARERAVWGVRDAGGFPAPMNPSGERAMPFWSLKIRVERIISQVRAYNGFEPVEIELDAFRERWLPDLEKINIRVGLNWVGVGATGFDFRASEVSDRLVDL